MPVFGLVLAAQAVDLGIGYANDLGLPTAVDDDPRAMAVSIVKFLMTFLGIIAVVIILYGGFLWLTASGNEDRVGKAKKTIIAGVIGLIVVLAAYAIVQFVISTATNMITTGNI
jgi:hypothetical protein